jgi:cytochrome P450
MKPDPDPFRAAREKSGVLQCPFKHEHITMLLRHEDVRQAAKNWPAFTSDAPFRVPIPSEEDLRTMRQLPIETDPPEHTEYREITEPFFQRPKDPAFIARVEALVGRLLADALQRDSIEAVHQFALPLQSHALTYLLNVPETEAATWIRWGIHVFHADAAAAPVHPLEVYLKAQFDRAETNPGDDFFSALVKAEFRGRRLTRDEMMGFANLAFAGGRDTIIHTISCALHHLAIHPEALEFLRPDPARVVHASEEFFRVFMPLTQIGRVSRDDTMIHGVTVKAGDRIGLCWASANKDETVFDAPEEVRLDRKPNPHLSFGFGPHLCMGAAHARLLMRTVLRLCCERVKTISVLSARERVESAAAYQRLLGFEELRLRFTPR